MRWRSLLVVALLILGGGLAAWFVARGQSARELPSSTGLRPSPTPTGVSEPLDPVAEDAAMADDPSRIRAPVAGDSDAAQGAPPSKSATAALRGFVLADDDTPVVEFDLELVRTGFFSSEQVERHFQSPKGEFCIESLTPGTWRIEASAPGFVLAGAAPEVKVPKAPLLLRMRRTTLVRGVVVDDAGAPATDAKAEATRIVNDTPGESRRDHCDEQGEFQFNDLPAGEYVFRAARGDLPPCGDPVRCSLKAGEQLKGLRLQLQRGGTITGEIAAARREEFREGEVMLLAGLEDLQERSAKLDERGSFRFDAVPAGTWWLVADHPRVDESAVPLLTAHCRVEDGGTTHVVLGSVDADSVRVHGRVLQRGEPVPSAFVSAFLDGRPALESARLVRTDETGHYELALGACGPATFYVSMHGDDLAAPRTHVLVPREREFALDLEFATCGVRGVVVDGDGKPRSGVKVWALPVDSSRLVLHTRSASEEQSDTQGRFEFYGLAPGDHVLLAGGQDLENLSGARARARCSLRLAAGEVREDVALKLLETTYLSGIVRDAVGRACPGMEVYARSAGGELFQPLPVGSSREDGRFTCDGLPPGAYSFFARSRRLELTGRCALATRPSEIVELHGETPDWLHITIGPGLELVAQPATMLHVDVVDRAGVALPGELCVLDESGLDSGGVIGHGDLDDALEHGTFGHRARFGPLPPGSYTLEGRTSDGHLASQKFTLAGEPERRLTIRVE